MARIPMIKLETERRGAAITSDSVTVTPNQECVFVESRVINST